MNKYSAPCQSEGISFFPVIVETFGGIHPDSVLVINKLARQLASQTGGKYEEVARHTYQRLGILLARGNSALITSRTPVFADANVDGDLDFD